MIRQHLEFLQSSGEFEQRHKRMVKTHVLSIAHDLVNSATNRQCESDDLLDRVVKKELAPHAAGRMLLARLVNSAVR